MLRVFLVLLMLGLLVIPAVSPGESAAGDEMSLLAINVRKADALLLRCGESAYLIDTGTEESFDRVYTVLKEEGITRLTGVILTHTHDDHTGGFAALVESDIDIGTVYASGYYNKKKEKNHPAVKALKNTDRGVTFLFAGDTIPLDGGMLTVIGPLEKDADKENNNSLVLLAEGGGGSILLTGDMEFPEEQSLLNAGAVPRADVLKVGNHGEDDATSPAFVQAVKPSVAVVSTSTEDEPDTPSPRVMRLLESWNVRVAETQESEKGVLVTLRGGEILTELK